MTSYVSTSQFLQLVMCESIAIITIESDPACQASSISLTKLTNGINDDNQMEPVIIIAPGSNPQVEWTYIVANNGTTPLTNIQVNDNMEGFICTVANLAPGETQTCTKIGTAGLGMYSNIGSVTGMDTAGNLVNDQDTSSYIGAYINVEKTANKSCVCPDNGDEVDFTLTIRLLGGAPGIQIGNISVSDSHLPVDLDINSPEFVQASDANLTVNETITNTAMDMGEVFYQGVSIGMANNESSVTITASDDCCGAQGNCTVEFKPVSTTNSDCSEANGAIDVTAVNGISPYNYIWSNGATTEDLFAVAAGTYSVTVTDALGCTAVANTTVDAESCGSIGNLIWEDIDADGEQGANEPGIPNVQVQLFDASTSTIVANTFTDANGNYLFSNVGAGSYFVKVVQLPGTHSDYIPTDSDATADGFDSDLTSTNGVWTTGTIVLTAEESNMTIDAGFYEGNMIGNQVWFEAAAGIANGFDAGDSPLENLEVNLYESATDTKVATRYTDPFGRYLFQEVPKGTYYLEFMAPANMTFIDDNALGGDDLTDSDAVVDQFDPHIGRSHDITVTTGTVDLTVDAGLTTLSTVLAVEMLDLTARHDSDKGINVVDWMTTKEVNSDFFSIERSIDGTEDFVEIGTERASGNTNSRTDYFYNDKDVEKSGTYYYRLRMVDLDGESKYSKVVSVNVVQDRAKNQKVTLDVYPNPVLNQINIDLVTEYDSKIDGGIYDAIGQLIKKVDNNSVTAGKTSMTMDVSELPAGTYLFRMQVGKQVIFEKITKAE